MKCKITKIWCKKTNQIVIFFDLIIQTTDFDALLATNLKK